MKPSAELQHKLILTLVVVVAFSTALAFALKMGSVSSNVSNLDLANFSLLFLNTLLLLIVLTHVLREEE